MMWCIFKTMSSPSRRERVAIGRTLKEFAFEQSPMFARDEIQSMEVAQEYDFIDQPPIPEEVRHVLVPDHISIRLAFYAMRLSNDKGKPPIYTYGLVTTGTQMLLPRELPLSEASWRTLHKRLLMDEVPGEAMRYHLDTVKDDVIETLLASGSDCRRFQKQVLSFSSAENAIESNYQYGISINGDTYEGGSTYEQLEMVDEWELVETAEGELYVPPRVHDDELTLGDEVEVRLQFDALVRETGLESRDTTDLLPHEDKLQQLRYAVECLRRRELIDSAD